MPNYRSIKLISLLFLIAFLLHACDEGNSEQNGYQAFTIQGETQGTTYTIIADTKHLLSLQDEIDAILLDFDRCLSSYRDSSIVSIFSNAEAGKYQFRDINSYFQRCLAMSEQVYHLSDGAFDPSVLPLVAAWGFMKNPALEMTQEQVDSVKNLIGFRNGIDYVYERKLEKEKIYSAEFTIEKIRPSLKLDFNAIAQGLAVDVLYEFLEGLGIENFYVEIGGELRVKGRNKDGELWRIGIDVADENNAVNSKERRITSVIALNNSAVATSGSYRKFYEKDGIKRSHTIDPKTGYPVQHSLLSATVVAPSAAFADAMATVFMVWGMDKSIEFVNQKPELNLEILLQFTDEKGEIGTYMSPGFKEMVLK
jgi:thiamine biosynthesis lipoprotein